MNNNITAVLVLFTAVTISVVSALVYAIVIHIQELIAAVIYKFKNGQVQK